MLKKTMLFLASFLLIASASSADLYQLDTAHTKIDFKVTSMVFFRTHGSFSDFTGSVDADVPNRTLKSAQATIQASSIDTGISLRNKHLRSEDFFDVSKYPEIRFVSKKVTGSGDKITVTGDLTIKNVTKEITLTGAFLNSGTGANGEQRVSFSAQGTVDRRDFGIVWNKVFEGGGVMIGNKIDINLHVEAVKQ